MVGVGGRLAWGQVLESGGGWRRRWCLLILAGVEKKNVGLAERLGMFRAVGYN